MKWYGDICTLHVLYEFTKGSGALQLSENTIIIHRFSSGSMVKNIQWCQSISLKMRGVWRVWGAHFGVIYNIFWSKYIIYTQKISMYVKTPLYTGLAIKCFLVYFHLFCSFHGRPVTTELTPSGYLQMA